MEYKQCSECKETKPKSEFSKNKARKDGLCDQCKACEAVRSAKYYSENRDEIGARKARYGSTEQGLISKLWGGMRQSCKRRGHKLEISREAFEQFVHRHLGKPCPYCGVEMTCDSNDDSKLSIDRIDSLITYVLDNIQAVCARCNLKKSDTQPERLMAIGVVEYYRKHGLQALEREFRRLAARPRPEQPLHWRSDK